MADNLLDLTTLIEQPTIKIDGVTHEIMHPDQLGILDFQRLSAMAVRLALLTGKPDIDDGEAAELVKIIEDLSDRIMVGVPADVRAKLTEVQRIAVAEVFMKIPGVRNRTTRKERRATKTKASRSAGSKPRSDASGSTAEARSDG